MRPSTKGQAGVSRRTVLKGAAAAIAGFPAIVSAQPVTLRYLGTAVNQSKEIAQKVKADLGLVIEYIPVTTDEVAKRIITQPNSSTWWTRVLPAPQAHPVRQPARMDARRIKYADKITPVFTKGQVAGKTIGDQGTAPKKVFYLEGRRRRSSPRRRRVDHPHSDRLQRRHPRHPSRPHQRPIGSWAELLNSEFKGRRPSSTSPRSASWMPRWWWSRGRHKSGTRAT